MIPKTIHFCWFSNDPYPDFIEKCMKSWERHMPDYKIKKWDSNSFDFDSVPFVKEAYELRKWAFVADYVRLYALYTEGGIYLDSDVFVKKSFDDFLGLPGFSAIEYDPKRYKTSIGKTITPKGELIDTAVEKVQGLQIQAAVIGSEAGNQYIKKCLDFYTGKRFVNPDGSLYNKIILPDIMAISARDLGFRYIDKKQDLDGKFTLYPSEVFAPHPFLTTKKTYAVHCCLGSWRDLNWMRRLFNNTRKKIWFYRNGL